MRDDPCFSCSLPDCDERSKDCRVRQLANRYDAKLRKGWHADIKPAEREASNRIYKIWEIERQAEAAEGGRPYRGVRPDAQVSS